MPILGGKTRRAFVYIPRGFFRATEIMLTLLSVCLCAAAFFGIAGFVRDTIANGYLGAGMFRLMLLGVQDHLDFATIRALAVGLTAWGAWWLHRGLRRRSSVEAAGFVALLGAAALLNFLLATLTGYSFLHAARRFALHSLRLLEGEIGADVLGRMFREHALQLVGLVAALVALVGAARTLRGRFEAGLSRLLAAGVAERWARGSRRVLPILVAPLVLAHAAVFLDARTVDPRRPNVVIVLSDALRRDHVGFYGYQRDTTPNLDRLARESVVFEHAFAQSSYTKSSIASLFTSLYPSQHRAVNNDNALDRSYFTLAEILAEGGYRTAAFTENPLIADTFRFDQGFSWWETDYRRHKKLDDRPMDEFDERLYRWLDRNGSRPFALYVHYIDPHDPYVPPPAFRRLFLDREPEAQSARDVLHYDQEIRYVDTRVGALVGKLQALGLLERTVFVFLSDHGEGFGPPDHGRGHANFLYGELIDIPLLIRWPGLPGGTRFLRPVSHVDLLPTLLALLGVQAPVPLEGHDVFAPAQSPHDAVIAEHLMLARGRRQRCIIRDGWKLIHDFEGDRYELFDLERDPTERADLAAQEPARVASLRDELATRLAALRGTREAPTVRLDADMQEKLRALGYLQ